MSKEKESNIITPLYSTFTLVGKPILPRSGGLVKDIITDKGLTSKINFGIKTSDTNIVYVEMLAFTAKKGKQIIYTLDTDNKKIEIDFFERLSKNIIDKVADFKKFKIQVASEKKEFISEFDAINELRNLDKDTDYLVQGDIRFEPFFSEKLQETFILTKYVIRNVTALLDTDEITPKAKAYVEFVYDKDGVDESNFKNDKKIYYNVKVTSYNKDLKKNIFVPLQLVFNAEKVNFEVEKEKKAFAFIRDILAIKDKKYYAFQVECNILKGVSKSDITYEDLTKLEKQEIDYGIKTLEEISKQKNSSVGGNKINELRIIRRGGKNIYDNGKILTDYTDIDFIIPETISKREKLEVLEEEDIKPPFMIDPEDDKDLNLDDLFGENN